MKSCSNYNTRNTPTPTPTKTIGTKRKFEEPFPESYNHSFKKQKRDWSDDEQKRYQAGLEQYGRNWKQIADYVHTRDEKAIRSHSQIHFLKLLKQRQQLPDKVKETGNGWTLSGEPLNKHSAAVKKVFDDPSKVPTDLGGVISDAESAEKAKFRKYGKKKKRRKKKTPIPTSDNHEQRHNSDPGVAIIKNEKNNENMDNFQITPRYSNQFDFKLSYCPNALLIADAHCHLIENEECIGLLAGTVDSQNNVVYIIKCFPIQYSNVCLLLDCINKLQEQLKNNNLQIVGWYCSHSHRNEYVLRTHNYLCLNVNQSQTDPFVGLIIKSWSSTTTQSEYQFYTMKNNVSFTMEPRKLVYFHISGVCLYRQMESLIRMYSDVYCICRRVDFGRVWRKQNKSLVITNKDKLFDSLKRNMDFDKDEMNRNSFIKRLLQLFSNKMHVWWRTNCPKQITNEKNSYFSSNAITHLPQWTYPCDYFL